MCDSEALTSACSSTRLRRDTSASSVRRRSVERSLSARQLSGSSEPRRTPVEVQSNAAKRRSHLIWLRGENVRSPNRLKGIPLTKLDFLPPKLRGEGATCNGIVSKRYEDFF
jgi:hypothetical protein